MARISDFQVKDVVNVADGKKLGNIIDLEIDQTNGNIISVILTKPTKGLNFFSKEEEIAIPWSEIVKIGEDVILVRYKMNVEIDEKSTTSLKF
ncbi:YlmC/YmxH family sporulation protein [Bacillus sp. RG28]|jgi:YlmC/YmxH family sporulation protein|uniref:YlmC/YmxH family sporulation protein n=1 Tax=Gottfriedia endophytica TaxID=2820819 RepID=A0A940NG49_9BACI|nr:YlmC/YmxH family sporulation protein [Gottfriedia endophytica]MBP0724824.1 YlmC/YmxH family sporulation protein [Gottfriedia endophytica]